MALLRYRLVLVIAWAAISAACPAQDIRPALDPIFSAERFMVVESYAGDWGGHTDTLLFTVEGDSIRIEQKAGERREALLPQDAVRTLQAYFAACSLRIDAAAGRSTEHIVYRFEAAGRRIAIDDRFSMACHEAYRAWIAMALGPPGGR